MSLLECLHVYYVYVCACVRVAWRAVSNIEEDPHDTRLRKFSSASL